MESYTIDKYFSGSDRMIGGLYPNVDAVESFYDRLLDLQDDEELRGLELHGFNLKDEQFSPFSFDVHKVMEIAETIVQYFVATDKASKAGRYEDVHALLETLLSAPESRCQGKIYPGEMAFAFKLAMRDIKFYGYKPENWTFMIDFPQAIDANNYIDNEHGFENLLRPSPWMRERRFPRQSLGSHCPV